MTKKYIIVWFIVLGCISCSKNDNNPPVIESITLEPGYGFTPGSDIILTAAVFDADGDSLNYFWECTAGVILDPHNRSATWTISVDAQPDSYITLTLTVSDGSTEVFRQRLVKISRGLHIAGHVSYKGTQIPVPGVSVSIGKFTTTSNEHGYYFLEHLKGGDNQILAEKDGFDTFKSEINVNSSRFRYNIQLNSNSYTHRLSGKVQTIDEFAFKGMQVVILNPNSTESELKTTTDSLGYYAIQSVPPGEIKLRVKNHSEEYKFPRDSILFSLDMPDSDFVYNPRMKIKRMILEDIHLSQVDRWDYDGNKSYGFYELEAGEEVRLKDYISVPPDAEEAMLYVFSYVIGGCGELGIPNSHRLKIIDSGGNDLGGFSWGGKGNNYIGELSWYPERYPTFIDLYGRDITLSFSVDSHQYCSGPPSWRIFKILFSYYY